MSQHTSNTNQLNQTNTLNTKTTFIRITKILLAVFILGMTSEELYAQSGGWDASSTNGTTGYNDYGNGVIQLMNTTSSGCAGSAIHETSDTYDPCSGTTFSKCYKVFFGCPDNDDIGSDTKGDGMAFSFSKCAYNINNGACGGGLGYHGACGQMITIEFDTWSSQGNAGFDGTYGGGTTGNNDEIAVHQNGDASNGGRLTSVNAGNLEDGLEHNVCITYNPGTNLLTVSVDGNTLLSYNYNLQTYFGCGGLNQTWSSGKFGATNPATVSNGADISDNVGAPLCPASVVITSPASGSAIGTCEGPVNITAAATPPAGNTVSYIEFFVDGVSIGTDNTDPYSTSWSTLSSGQHALTAVAHYSGGSTSTSSAVNMTIGGGVELTSSAPAIDGSVDAIWGNYTSLSLNQVPVPTVTNGADLTASFKTMRDATYLYLLVTVTDDNLRDDGGLPWEDDGVEVFIDMGNNKNGTYGANDYQYAFTYNRATITEYYHNATGGVTFAQGAIAGGYIMEIRFPWATLGTAPVNGELIGFDVHVNDDDDGGTRDGKKAWYDAVDIAFHNPSGFGTVSASVCNPCPSGILSGDSILCSTSATSPLTIEFEGNSPWSFTYSIDGVTQPAITGITTSPYEFSSGTGTHTYALVTVSNPQTSGCTGNTSGTAIITANTAPTGHDDTFVTPGSATLSVDNTGGTYQWYDAPTGGTLVFTGDSYTTPVLNDTAVYYVQEISQAPCRTEVTAFPIEPTVPEEDLFIPNLVTPNNDGMNDYFEISGLPSGSAVNLFNRWGDKVYQSEDYNNRWQASSGSDGVYYYEVVLPDGTSYKGWVNVMR